MVTYQKQPTTRNAFTLVENLMMLVALAVFTLTGLAVLKKDQFSTKVVMAKFHEGEPAQAGPAPVQAKPKADPASAKEKPAVKVAAPLPEGAKAGSPAAKEQAH